MEKMTLTEALSEINLVKKKIEKKALFVLENLIRSNHVKDPYESYGGSRQANDSETQAIKDLGVRLIKLRGAISLANINNTIEIESRSMSIHDWLIWKREVSKNELEFSAKIPDLVKRHIDQCGRQPQVYKDDEGKTHLVEFNINIDYPAFQKENQRVQETLDKLDGKLSLKNATIVVEI